MQLDLDPSPPSPDDFLDDLFDCDAARAGHVVQVSHLDMERFVGRERFISDMKKRRFTAVQNRSQIFIFCNNRDLRLIA